MGTHIFLTAIVNVMRMRRDLRVMRGIIPSFQQPSCRVLPVEAIFRDQKLSIHNLKTLEYLQETAILKCNPKTKQPKIALRLFA